jgi:putative ABC transport system permease protein
VRSASYSADTPLGGSVGANYVRVDGRSSPSTERDLVFFNLVSDGYFEALGTRLLAGRDFNRHDTASSPKVAIVNESFAKKYFSGKSPVGASYRAEHGGKFGDPVQIIGLVRDVKYLDLREDFHPLVYTAAGQEANPGEIVTFELLVAAQNPFALISAAKSVIAKAAPNASVQFRTLASQVDESLAREQLLAAVSGFFGLLALLLALVGLYGITSYSVARRRSEIGIRIALGAGQSGVLRAVFAEVGVVVSIGLAIGVAGTLVITRLLASFLYGVRANDPLLLGLAVITLAVTAAVAGFIPAYRASRLNPMETLREE